MHCAQPEGLQDFTGDHVRLSEGEDFFTLDKETLIAASDAHSEGCSMRSLAQVTGFGIRRSELNLLGQLG